MIEGIKHEAAKKIVTRDLHGTENGFLVELYKDGRKTVAYLTTLKVGAFKGYHLHRVRAARYLCLKGKVRLILHKENEKEEYVLEAASPHRLEVPNNVATGLENVGDEEVWLINYPNPAYDPDLKDEQVEYTEEELKQGVVK